MTNPTTRAREILARHCGWIIEGDILIDDEDVVIGTDALAAIEEALTQPQAISAEAVGRVQSPTTGALERFYIDCEFDGHGGPLLSFAVVREDGSGLHIRTTERARDPWVQQNVEPLMEHHRAESDFVSVEPNYVGEILREFIGGAQRPVIIADSPVDIGRFCAAISTSKDGGWASTGYEQMTFEVHNVDCYPNDLTDAVQHNAYWDAMVLRHKLIEALSRPSPDSDAAWGMLSEACDKWDAAVDARKAREAAIHGKTRAERALYRERNWTLFT